MTRNCPVKKDRPCKFKRAGQIRQGTDAHRNKYTKTQPRCIYCYAPRHSLMISRSNRLT